MYDHGSVAFQRSFQIGNKTVSSHDSWITWFKGPLGRVISICYWRFYLYMVNQVPTSLSFSKKDISLFDQRMASCVYSEGMPCISPQLDGISKALKTSPATEELSVFVEIISQTSHLLHKIYRDRPNTIIGHSTIWGWIHSVLTWISPFEL